MIGSLEISEKEKEGGGEHIFMQNNENLDGNRSFLPGWLVWKSHKIILVLILQQVLPAWTPRKMRF